MMNGSSNTIWHVDYIGKNVQSWKVLNSNHSIFLLLFVVSIFTNTIMLKIEILEFYNLVYSSLLIENVNKRNFFFHLSPNLLRFDSVSDRFREFFLPFFKITTIFLSCLALSALCPLPAWIDPLDLEIWNWILKKTL